MTLETDVIALKAKVHELDEHLKYVYTHLNITYFENQAEADSKIIELLKSGNKIEAVKMYKEMHNTGLAEAKKYIDNLESRLGI